MSSLLSLALYLNFLSFTSQASNTGHIFSCPSLTPRLSDPPPSPQIPPTNLLFALPDSTSAPRTPHSTPHTPQPKSRLRRYNPLDRRSPLPPFYILTITSPPQYPHRSQARPQRPLSSRISHPNPNHRLLELGA